MSDSWKLAMPCTKAEAEAIALVEIDAAVLVTTEEDEGAGRWRLDAYFESEPDAATLATVRALVQGGGTATPAPLPAQDWVTLSQADLAPIREGRFIVHTAAHPADPPAGGRAFLIDAGQAFGTGHHATTAGCLAALDGYRNERAVFRDVVDLGTGTGLLAFAARELWPDADVLATDIDPIAVAVARENAEANGVPGIAFAVADGARNLPVPHGRAFDLVIANILAGPLIAMAPEIAAVTAPRATILLAGLLTTQADAVIAAYAAVGCEEARRAVRGDWTILELVAPAVPVAAATHARGRGDWATDS